MGGGYLNFYLGRALFVEKSRTLLAGFVSLPTCIFKPRRGGLFIETHPDLPIFSFCFSAAPPKNKQNGPGTAQSINRPPLRDSDQGLFPVLACALLLLSGCDRNSSPAAGAATNASLAPAPPALTN